jgi:hypothetical protein
MRTHRVLAARWREVIAAALIACSGKVGGGAHGPPSNEAADGGGPSQTGAEAGAAELEGGADGGADAPDELVTGLDGGPVFVYGPPDPDASNWCAGGAVGGSRPVQVRTPSGYDCASATWPLVILLHDYGS